MTLRFTLLLAAMGVALPASGSAERLSIERIFASPDLAGPTLRKLEVSPAGDRVTFLRGKTDDREQLDLWEYNVADAELRLLVDSRQLLPEEGELSDEEKARRERQRIAGLRGIVDYVWSRDGKALLFPLGGDLYHFDLDTAAGSVVKRLTQTEAFETDPQLSPSGTHVAFIRDQNLFAVEIVSGEEHQLTSDGGGLIKNGMAEFIAQEEMDRDTGYWWAPDAGSIAYLQVDQSPVAVSRRYEIYAEKFDVIEQRYPYAGANNVTIKLGVVNLETRQTRWYDLGEDTDIYIPRVNWLPDNKSLTYQLQSRDQKTLRLRLVDVGRGTQKTLLTERAGTWVDLHDDLYFLKGQASFVWASERSGFKHLYLGDLEGRSLRPLTAGTWSVDELEGVDEKQGLIYFTAAEASPLEQHLYSQSLDTDAPQSVTRITTEPGTHRIDMNRKGDVFVDSFSSRQQPPRVSLHRADGSRLTWLIENQVDADHPYDPYRESHQQTEFGTLEAEDGQTLHYYLMKPPGFSEDQKYPVFMYLYGGPTGQLVSNSWGRRILFEQYMAQQGFVVFVLDNRGTPRRGKDFQTPVYQALGTVEVRDQGQGVEYLKSLPWVDPDRIGLFGWSYGGYMTLMGLMQLPDAWAVGVSVAPVTDWRLYDTHYTERFMARPRENAAGYAAGDVLTYADSLSKPLLIMHGMADDNVLFTNSTKLFKRLQDAGVAFDMMTYPGGKHGLSGQASQTHAYNQIANYFIQHLRPLPE
jgi:dipeptidyl-peptidase-4